MKKVLLSLLVIARALNASETLSTNHDHIQTSFASHAQHVVKHLDQQLEHASSVEFIDYEEEADFIRAKVHPEINPNATRDALLDFYKNSTCLIWDHSIEVIQLPVDQLEKKVSIDYEYKTPVRKPFKYITMAEALAQRDLCN